MMNKRIFNLGTTIIVAVLLFSQWAIAGVEQRQLNSLNHITYVSDDDWQPGEFVNGTPVPATWQQTPDINIDGTDDEPAWSQATEVEVPLNYGSVERVWLKALYSNDEVFIRVRWSDSTEDRQHRPWTWDSKLERYVAGPQIEDSVMLSFEAGCEWTPSLLGGYVFDFDAWHWLAARSDPLGQALDLYGNVQDRGTKLSSFKEYQSRVVEKDWILKFTENRDINVNANWDEIDRVYLMQPVTKKLWVRTEPDGGRRSPAFVEQKQAPTFVPQDTSKIYPQFSPVKLTGGAAEVAAKGQWKDGNWTVEFRRDRETPAGHINDTIFNRLMQFSVHVFDQVDRVDQSSESGRLFLQFLPKGPKLVNN